MPGSETGEIEIYDEIEKEQDSTNDEVRQNVAERDDRRCQVCGRPAETQHHILPRARGGTDSEDNLVTLCEPHHRLVHEEKMNIINFEPKEKCVVEIDGRRMEGYITDRSRKIKLAEKSHEVHNRIVDLCEIIRKSWVELGALLYHVKSEKLYETIGYDTFGSYIADPEVNVSRPKANRAIRCVKRLYYGAGIRQKQLEEMGIAKADRISKYWDKPEEIEELAEIAPAASRSDLKAELNERKEGNDDSGESEHDGEDQEENVEDRDPHWLRRLKKLTDGLEPNEVEKLEEIIKITKKQLKALRINAN